MKARLNFSRMAAIDARRLALGIVFDAMASFSLLSSVLIAVLWCRAHWYFDGFIVRWPSVNSRTAVCREWHLNFGGDDGLAVLHYLGRRSNGISVDRFERVAGCDLTKRDFEYETALIAPEDRHVRNPLANRVGFHYQTTHFSVPYDWARGTETIAVFPLWAPFVMSSILPVLWLRGHLRLRARARGGRCLRCGYDLRATPDRCPECGTVPRGQISIRD